MWDRKVRSQQRENAMETQSNLFYVEVARWGTYYPNLLAAKTCFKRKEYTHQYNLRLLTCKSAQRAFLALESLTTFRGVSVVGKHEIPKSCRHLFQENKSWTRASAVWQHCFSVCGVEASALASLAHIKTVSNCASWKRGEGHIQYNCNVPVGEFVWQQ